MADLEKIKRNVSRMIAQDAPERDIQEYLSIEGVTPEQLRGQAASQPVGVMEDVAKSYPVGVARGVLGFGGSFGDIGSTMKAVGNKAADAIGYAFGADPALVERGKAEAAEALKYSPLALFTQSRTTPELTQAAESVTGKFYEPQTVPGEYARTLGEFTPGAVAPGSIPMRVIGGVVAPALASETAGQLTKGSPYEGAARTTAGVIGGLGGTGAVAAFESRRPLVPGVSARSGRLLEKNVAPDAEQRLTELGPDAFLYEGSPATTGLAQGVATRTGEGQNILVGATKDRAAGANARLGRDMNQALGPASVPSVTDAALKSQMKEIGREYPGALRGAQRMDARAIIRQLTNEIDVEAGNPKKTLEQIKSYFYRAADQVDPHTGEVTKTGTVLKSSAEELHNVREALDDLYTKVADQPRSAGLVTKYRKMLDGMMPSNVKDIDRRFAEFAKQRDALSRGSQVLNTGKEAIPPTELAIEMTGMSSGQKSLLKAGARAELERLIGTKSNDVRALKSLVQSEGDWNRTKLAQLFGQDQADQILRAVDRETAFADAVNKIVENSQTAQRLGGAKAVETVAARPAPTWGGIANLPLTGGKAGYDRLAQLISGKKQVATDTELAKLLTTTGRDRDSLVSLIRDAQARRASNRVSGSAIGTRSLLNLMSANRQ